MKIAKRIVLAAMLAATAVTALQAEPAASGATEKQMAEAKAAMGELGARLKDQLLAAVKEKGAAGALDVCKTVATQAAAEIGGQRNIVIKRTALKVRNGANQPDAFETRVLTEFTAKADSGADPQSLSYSQVVEEDGVKKLRIVKAIPMAEQPCATCHGAQVKPDLLQKIRELYPTDQATGFLPGQVRGAFSVTINAD